MTKETNVGLGWVRTQFTEIFEQHNEEPPMAVRLENCPPGLFIFHGVAGACMGFKSEYRTTKYDEAGHVVGSQTDAYVITSGEYFWGGTKGDWRAREKLLVEPVDEEMLQVALQDLQRS